MKRIQCTLKPDHLKARCIRQINVCPVVEGDRAFIFCPKTDDEGYMMLITGGRVLFHNDDFARMRPQIFDQIINISSLDAEIVHVSII